MPVTFTQGTLLFGLELPACDARTFGHSQLAALQTGRLHSQVQRTIYSFRSRATNHVLNELRAPPSQSCSEVNAVTCSCCTQYLQKVLPSATFALLAFSCLFSCVLTASNVSSCQSWFEVLCLRRGTRRLYPCSQSFQGISSYLALGFGSQRLYARRRFYDDPLYTALCGKRPRYSAQGKQ